MIILTVRSKKFGKNFVDYDAMDSETGEIIRSGKCNDFTTTRAVYVSLMKEHGEENVMLLTK